MKREGKEICRRLHSCFHRAQRRTIDTLFIMGGPYQQIGAKSKKVNHVLVSIRLVLFSIDTYSTGTVLYRSTGRYSTGYNTGRARASFHLVRHLRAARSARAVVAVVAVVAAMAVVARGLHVLRAGAAAPPLTVVTRKSGVALGFCSRHRHHPSSLALVPCPRQRCPRPCRHIPERRASSCTHASRRAPPTRCRASLWSGDD